MKHKIVAALLIVLGVIVFGAAWLFVFSPPQAEKITWGVNFSQKHARDLGLDWQETYLAILDNLKARNIKLISHWDLLEPSPNQYYFDDLDWQIAEADKRDTKVHLVIGMKTGRWPECHIPDWAQNLSKEEQQKEILDLIENIALRYQGSDAILRWQVENEPLFPFGLCPWQDKDFVKKEVELVKSLDVKNRPVMVSDSGELSLWWEAARLGDIVGITMYNKVWSQELKMYLDFPSAPAFYWQKARLVDKLFSKKVIVVELQTEPWGPQLLYDLRLSEQKETMTLEQFGKNVEFAKRTGFDEFYLWGAEWWYWLKKNHPQDQDSKIWEAAKVLF